MKLTLIQSGGFAGITKIAEEDLSKKPPALQRYVKNIFSKKPVKTEPSTVDMGRDKENYFLEYNDTRVSLNTIKMNDDLQKLVLKMKNNLKYKKT